ncbi:hypothetical protein PV10_06359 [Exophiala mesophila]|uniref:Zn(2)-C6 fungal-type domain-containing protein n=1 Tax=Exophiala mesophila TaxID=212818 RepID=A0A0D1ZYA6_EXOME|nr:uncharacterized protein PV10_06359 [Exophiala mesophila]KIV91868.1 hypothetical protein PV10_06359 [Exophiala mesophila]
MTAPKVSSSTPRRPASSTPVKRSRTGCLTCRQRKLKCDEQRPQCGQCQKSHRECVQSEGIAWRHNQNAGRVGGDEKSLGSFFKYTNFFTDEQRRMFVPVPSQLTFVYVDPTTEEVGSPPPGTPSTSEAQQVAAHSLEALSTAAAVGNTNTTNYPAQYYTNPQTSSYPEYSFVRLGDSAGDSQGLGSLTELIPPRSPPNQVANSLIDPSLEESVSHPPNDGSIGNTDGAQDLKSEDVEASQEDDSHVALALQKFNAST